MSGIGDNKAMEEQPRVSAPPQSPVVLHSSSPPRLDTSDVQKLLAPIPLSSSGFTVNVPFLTGAANQVAGIAADVLDATSSAPGGWPPVFLSPQSVLGDYPAAQGLMNSFNLGGRNLATYPITDDFILSLVGYPKGMGGAQYALSLTAQNYDNMEMANEAAIGKAIVASENSPNSGVVEALAPSHGGIHSYWGSTAGLSDILAFPIRLAAAAGSWGNFGGMAYDIDNIINHDQTYRILYAMVQAMQPAAVEDYAQKFHGYASALMNASIKLRNVAMDVLTEWTGMAREEAKQDLAATIGLGAVISAGMTAMANAAEWHAAKQRAWQHALPPPGERGWDTSNQAALKLMDEIQQQTVQTNDAIPSSLNALGLRVPFAGSIGGSFSV